MDRVYIKYEPNNKLSAHEDILHNQIEKDIKALARAVCIINNTNWNITHL